MANFNVCRSVFWVTLGTCVVFCVASPASRRQFVSYTETTSSDPSVVVTNDGETWDDSDDDFDLEGGGWMKEVSVAPPSPLAFDYEDYDVYDDDEDDTAASQTAEVPKDNKPQDAEFLFLPPTDNRLVLEDDDDDQPGLIKVRHSSKNVFPDPQEDVVDPVESFMKEDPNGQFVFTIDEDDDDDNKANDKDDDFVLEDDDKKSDEKLDTMPRRDVISDDDDDDDDNSVDDNSNDNPMFESPEEDAQVIYGDHVFLY